jgi:hypothetical protein
MKEIPLTENAVKNHEELFPNLESKLQETDPEFIALFWPSEILGGFF